MHIYYSTSSSSSDNQAMMIPTSQSDRREDFSEYLWMEDIESFDKQVLAELEEEEEIEQCMEEMLAEEEERDTTYYSPEIPEMYEVEDEDENEVIRPEEDYISEGLAHLMVDDILLQSQLNPDAEEFIPGRNLDSSSELSDSSEASDR